MDGLIVTGTTGTTVRGGSGKPAWLRLPKGVTHEEAVERGWAVVEVSGVTPRHLVLCEQVTYYDEPTKVGTFWEPVQFDGLPVADLH